MSTQKSPPTSTFAFFTAPNLFVVASQWYEEAFEELKTVSNIDDLDRLVTVFMKQEDEHFSLFNYIQTVNQETDQHLEKTEELEVNMVTLVFLEVLAYPRMTPLIKQRVASDQY